VAEPVWTPLELLRWTTGYLAGKNFHNARLNAELLLAGVLRCKRLDLYLQFDRPLGATELAEFKTRLRRRARREPLQYIEGTAAFRNLVLRVDPRVLIPRPETELLVGEVLRWSEGRTGLAALDVGTGSGAVAISLATEGGDRFDRVVATDVSLDAIQLASANAADAGCTVEFREGSVYTPVRGEQFDVVVSNPPYIAESERGELDVEVRDWEPQSALFAGADGLSVLRDLVRGAGAHLTAGGLLALETGSGQTEIVAALIRGVGGFAEPRVVPDLAGRSRMVLAAYRGRE
jgi:release factor glutamine methyltransferase